MGLEWVQKGSILTPESTLQDRSRDGPQIALRSLIPRPQETNGPERALFSVLLTIAERKEVMSKDWIRAPTQSQE